MGGRGCGEHCKWRCERRMPMLRRCLSLFRATKRWIGTARSSWRGSAGGFRRKYVEQELLEVSAVGIPANPNALALGLKAGAVEKSDLRELQELLRETLGEAKEARNTNTLKGGHQTGGAKEEGEW